MTENVVDSLFCLPLLLVPNLVFIGIKKRVKIEKFTDNNFFSDAGSEANIIAMNAHQSFQRENVYTPFLTLQLSHSYLPSSK